MSHLKPSSRYLVSAALAIIAVTATAGPLAIEREKELEYMLLQDCGSCHGMTLKGGLGPALTPQAMLDKPRVYLKNTIRDGHPGTPMPPWGGLLSEQDIDYLIDILKRQIKNS